jgi:hypothetical protein
MLRLWVCVESRPERWGSIALIPATHASVSRFTHHAWTDDLYFLSPLHVLAKCPVFTHFQQSLPFSVHSDRTWRALPQNQQPWAEVSNLTDLLVLFEPVSCDGLLVCCWGLDFLTYFVWLDSACLSCKIIWTALEWLWRHLALNYLLASKRPRQCG